MQCTEAMHRVYRMQRRFVLFSPSSAEVFVKELRLKSSVLLYAAVCWGGSIRPIDARRLDKLVKRAGCDWSQVGHTGGGGGEIHCEDV